MTWSSQCTVLMLLPRLWEWAEGRPWPKDVRLSDVVPAAPEGPAPPPNDGVRLKLAWRMLPGESMVGPEGLVGLMWALLPPWDREDRSMRRLRPGLPFQDLNGRVGVGVGKGLDRRNNE